MTRAALVLMLSVVCADAGAQNTFTLWGSIGSSGMPMSADSMGMISSLGQPVSGPSLSSNTTLHTGFLAFAGVGGPVSSANEPPGGPVAYSLAQNYPNPFNPSTTIRYELPKSSMVRLSVYDILGREVSVLVNERRDAGVHEVKLDATGLSSGVYFYRLQAGDFVASKKLLLLK